MPNINQIINMFSKDFDVNRLLENIVQLLICGTENVCSHIRVSFKDRYKTVGSIGWFHELVSKEREKDDPLSSSALAAKVGIPIAIDITTDREKSYGQILKQHEEKYSVSLLKKLSIDLNRSLNEDFSEVFDKAIKNSTNYIYILPIISEEVCLAIIHIFSDKRISDVKLPQLTELMDKLTLPLSSFIRHYQKEDELLTFSCELNEHLLKKVMTGHDFIEFIINRTAHFFNVDECALSLIYKDKKHEDTKYTKYIQLVGSNNISEANIQKRIKDLKDQPTNQSVRMFKDLGLEEPRSFNHEDIKSRLEKVLDGAHRPTPLQEDEDVALRTPDLGLRRLCVIAGEIIVYYPELRGKQERRIEFYSMSTGSLISKKEIEERWHLKDAKTIVHEHRQWQRHKGHLIFFQKSDCECYNVIHAPLIVREGEDKEVIIGVLTIENRLNNEGKVEVQTFSDYEIETVKRWVNIISYCIENKKRKDLFREIINSCPQGIIFSNISGQIIEMSPRAKNILKGETQDAREIYFDNENLNKVSSGLKESAEKAKKKPATQKTGFDGYFARLKNLEDGTSIWVEGSAYNVPNFIPDILPRVGELPRAGTVGYIQLDKQRAIANIIIDDLFETLSRKELDPEDAICHILEEIPRILEAKGCVLFTCHDMSVSDEKEKGFIEEERSYIINKHDIEFIKSNKFQRTDTTEPFDLKHELEKYRSCKVLKYKRSSGLRIEGFPQYLVIPDSDCNISFEKEGLTAYAARTQKIIRLDIEKERHPSKNGTKTGQCDSVLNIPILEPVRVEEEEPETVGVLKIQEKYGRTFTEVDETIAQIIAKALSFLIVGGVSLYNMECGGKILELILDNFEDTWDKQAYEAIKKFRNQVSKFSFIENEREHIYDSVEELFNQLSELFEIPESLKTLSEKFRKEERVLYGLPGYREHFLHQFHDFLAGYHIITLLKPERMVFLLNLNRLGIRKQLEHDEVFVKFVKTIFDNPSRSYKDLCDQLSNFKIEKELLEQIKGKELEQEKKDLLKLWFLTTIFHDIAYYVEKMNVWLGDYIEKVVGEQTKYHICWEPFIKDAKFDGYIRHYASMLSEDYDKRVRIEVLIRNKILENQDHGIVSSLLFLKESPEDSTDRQIYEEAALAIALHNFPIWQKECLPEIIGRKISFFDHPIPCLFTYCDFIQEWGREFHRGARLNHKVKLEALDWVEGQIVCTLRYPEEPKPIHPEDKMSFDDRIYEHLTNMYDSWDWKGVEKPLFKIIYDINITTPYKKVKMEIYSLDGSEQERTEPEEA